MTLPRTFLSSKTTRKPCFITLSCSKKGDLSNMVNAKEKGKRGERMWVSVLRFFGFKAKRTGFHQSQQGSDAPDVTCPDTSPIHWEVKNTKLCKIKDWMSQAEGDCKPWEIPVIVWRNEARWVAILPDAEDFLEILQKSDLKDLEEQRQINNKPKKNI